MDIQETPTPTSRKSVLPYIIGAGLIVLLAAAAFMAVRYFAQPKNAAGGSGPGRNIMAVKGAGGAEQVFALNVKSAEELPATQPEATGMFVERKDNSVFVGTGDTRVMVKAEPGEEPQMDSSFSGPKVEVVISADTVIYKDTTNLDPEDPGAEVQQTVELSTIDEITEHSSITVWGRKAGDRILADVIVFSTPFSIRKPGAP
jgi:hypothetical protein